MSFPNVYYLVEIWVSGSQVSDTVQSCQCTTEATELDEMNLKVLNCGVEKTLESPLDCKEIQPVNPKGISPELEGLMLKLKLQYFDQLM